MSQTFSVGDTVVLKSGGPLMTIESIGDEIVWCAWFVNDDKKRGQFPPDTLDFED